MRAPRWARRHLPVIGILVAAWLVAYAPVLVFGFPANAWDSRYQLMTAAEFLHQFSHDEWYPRWLIDANGGLGSPHFFFYAPLAYVITAVLGPVAGTNPVHQLGFTAAILALLSSIFCFAWLRRLVSPAPALAGAIVYLAAPNHLFMDLLIRADYAEYCALTFPPLAMLGAEQILSGQRRGGALVALATAAVILCNTSAGLIFIGVPLSYILVRLAIDGWESESRAAAFTVVAWCAIGTTLGLALSAVYLLPALAYLPEVASPVIPMEPRVFMFGDPAPPKLVLLQWALYVVYGVLLLAAAFQWRRHYRGAAYTACLAVAAVTWLLMGIWARPLWGVLPVVSAVQFTARMLLVLELLGSALIAFECHAVWTAPAPASSIRRHVAVATPAIITLIAAIACSLLAMREGIFNYDQALWQYRLETLPDYGLFRPKTVTAPLPVDLLPLYGGGVFPPAGMERVSRVTTSDQGVTTTILAWQPRHVALFIKSPAATVIKVGQLYVPRWRAVERSTHARLPVSASTGRGLVEIAVPPGEHTVDLVMPPLAPEYTGAVVSIFAAAGIAWLLLRPRQLTPRRSPS